MKNTKIGQQKTFQQQLIELMREKKLTKIDLNTKAKTGSNKAPNLTFISQWVGSRKNVTRVEKK